MTPVVVVPMSDAERVLRLLTNASVTQADMAYVLGLPIRSIQAACEELRRTGHPVLSSGDGMRLGTAEEALTCATALRKRAITQLVTSRALRRTARAMRVREDAAARATLWDFLEGAAS